MITNIKNGTTLPTSSGVTNGIGFAIYTNNPEVDGTIAMLGCNGKGNGALASFASSLNAQVINALYKATGFPLVINISYNNNYLNLNIFTNNYQTGWAEAVLINKQYVLW